MPKPLTPPLPLFFLAIIIVAALFLGNSDPISAATGQAKANALLARWLDCR